MQDFLLSKPIKLHAVTYNEMVKIPALLYAVTNDKNYLNASIKGLKRIEKIICFQLVFIVVVKTLRGKML